MSCFLRNFKRTTSDGREGSRTKGLLGHTKQKKVIPGPKSMVSGGGSHSQQLLLQRTSTNSSGPHKQQQIFVQRHQTNDLYQQQQKSKQGATRHQLGSKQQQTTKQKRNNMDKQQQQQQQQQTPAVISMDEVLKDLRVLEQQQRESQRKLASARLTKQHKLEQQASLENHVETLKYSNGELRAQLRQSRDLLSSLTRELGTRRLAADGMGDYLRNFDRKLKQGLFSARMIAIYRLKSESSLDVARNRESSLAKLKEEEKKKLKQLEKIRDEAFEYEESLRKRTLDEKQATEEFAVEVSRLRNENKLLEQDLMETRAMEQTTKLRAEEAESEIQTENKRHTEAMADLTAKLENLCTTKKGLEAEQKSIVLEIKEKTSFLHDAWNLCIRYQEEEGHETSPPPSDDKAAAPPVFDMSKLCQAIEQEDAILLEIAAKKQGHEVYIEKLRNEKVKLETFATNDLAEARSLTEAAPNDQKVEDRRRNDFDAFLKEIMNKRNEVKKLKDLIEELDATRLQEASRSTEHIKEQKKVIEMYRESLDKGKVDLEAEEAAAETIFQNWEKEKDEIYTRAQEAKTRATAAEKNLQMVTSEAAQVVNESDDVTKQEEARLKRKWDNENEESEAEISRLLQKYPELKSLVFKYIPGKTTAQQAEEDLAGLRADCHGRIEAAKKIRNEKREERKEAKRLADAAVAEVKRKEEESRQREERLKKEEDRRREERLEAEKIKAAAAAEVERKEEELRLRERRLEEAEAALKAKKQEEYRREQFRKGEKEANSATKEEDFGKSEKVLAGSHDPTAAVEKAKRNSEKPLPLHEEKSLRRAAQGASFYFPESQEDTVEQETPARPQSLLPAFTMAEKHGTMNNNHSVVPQISQDRRVRWEDEDDTNACSVSDVVADQNPNDGHPKETRKICASPSHSDADKNGSITGSRQKNAVATTVPSKELSQSFNQEDLGKNITDNSTATAKKAQSVPGDDAMFEERFSRDVTYKTKRQDDYIGAQPKRKSRDTKRDAAKYSEWHQATEETVTRQDFDAGNKEKNDSSEKIKQKDLIKSCSDLRRRSKSRRQESRRSKTDRAHIGSGGSRLDTTKDNEGKSTQPIFHESIHDHTGFKEQEGNKMNMDILSKHRVHSSGNDLKGEHKMSKVMKPRSRDKSVYKIHGTKKPSTSERDKPKPRKPMSQEEAKGKISKTKTPEKSCRSERNIIYGSEHRNIRHLYAEDAALLEPKSFSSSTSSIRSLSSKSTSRSVDTKLSIKSSNSSKRGGSESSKMRSKRETNTSSNRNRDISKDPKPTKRQETWNTDVKKGDLDKSIRSHRKKISIRYSRTTLSEDNKKPEPKSSNTSITSRRSVSSKSTSRSVDTKASSAASKSSSRSLDTKASSRASRSSKRGDGGASSISSKRSNSSNRVRKRSLSTGSVCQSSSITSTEKATKMRRRKKSDTITSKTKAAFLSEDKYDFSF